MDATSGPVLLSKWCRSMIAKYSALPPCDPAYGLASNLLPK
jgi:hypothetical protein